MNRRNTGLHADVEMMVGTVLNRLARPHGEDVIEDVFVEIERSPYQLRQYLQLSATSSRAAVNQGVGHVTRVLTGYRDGKPANKTRRTTLASSYTKLIPRS